VCYIFLKIDYYGEKEDFKKHEKLITAIEAHRGAYPKTRIKAISLRDKELTVYYVGTNETTDYLYVKTCSDIIRNFVDGNSDYLDWKFKVVLRDRDGETFVTITDGNDGSVLTNMKSREFQSLSYYANISSIKEFDITTAGSGGLPPSEDLEILKMSITHKTETEFFKDLPNLSKLTLRTNSVYNVDFLSDNNYLNELTLVFYENPSKKHNCIEKFDFNSLYKLNQIKKLNIEVNNEYLTPFFKDKNGVLEMLNKNMPNCDISYEIIFE
jgi:hypothetical protein